MNKLLKVAGIFSLMVGFFYAGFDKPLGLLVERAALM